MDDNNATILNTLLEIKQDIGDIKARLEGNKERSLDQETKTNYLASRVSVIENQQQKWKWTMAGATATCVALFKAIEIWWTHGGPHQ